MDVPGYQPNFRRLTLEDDCRVRLDSAHQIEKEGLNNNLIEQILHNKLIDGKFSIGGRITPSWIEKAIRHLFEFGDDGFFINHFSDKINEMDPNIGYIGEIYHYLAIVVLAEYYSLGLGMEGTEQLRNVMNLFPDFKENVYDVVREGDPHLTRKPFLTQEDYLELTVNPDYFLEDVHERDHLDYLFYRPQVSDALNNGHVYDYLDYFELGKKERIHVIKIIQSISKFINNFLHDKNKVEGDSLDLTEEEYRLRQYIADNLEEFLKVILNLSGLFESFDWGSIGKTSKGEVKIMAEPPIAANLQIGRTTMASFKANVEIIYKDNTDNKRITKRPLYWQFKEMLWELFGNIGIEYDDDKKLIRFPFAIDNLKMQSSNRPDLLVFKDINGEQHVEIIDYKRTMPTADDEATDMSVLLYKLNTAILLTQGGYRRPKDNFNFTIPDFYDEETESYNEAIIDALINKVSFYYFDVRTGEKKEGLPNPSREYIYKLLNTLRLIQEIKITYSETIKQALNTPDEDLLEFDKPD